MAELLGEENIHRLYVAFINRLNYERERGILKILFVNYIILMIICWEKFMSSIMEKTGRKKLLL